MHKKTIQRQQITKIPENIYLMDYVQNIKRLIYGIEDTCDISDIAEELIGSIDL